MKQADIMTIKMSVGLVTTITIMAIRLIFTRMAFVRTETEM